VLAFLPLKDLSVLVRCSRRFNNVARKERSRGVYIRPAVRSIPLLVRSSLSHHITSVRVVPESESDAPINRTTLEQLRALPQLTELAIHVFDNDTAERLLQGVPSADSASAGAALQAVLPTTTRSLSINTRPLAWRLPLPVMVTLGTAFFAAAATMHTLTELNVWHERWDGVQMGAVSALPLLRKMKLTGPLNGAVLSEVKQLSQLRKLTLELGTSEDLLSLCQPPHSLQLETLRVELWILAAEMRALLQLPTLTELDVNSLHSSAFPLLPHLPLLRTLKMDSGELLTSARTSSLSASLARLNALEDLTFLVEFDGDDEGEDELLPNEELEARWTQILRSVPNLRRMVVETKSSNSLVAVLHAHLPRLEQLALRGWEGCENLILTQLAHPTLKQFGFETRELTEEEIHSLLHNPRLPRLVSCSFV
jgi:hypothetical protein